MALIIRPLAAADRSEWTRLWRAYLEFYKSSVPEAVYDATFARLLNPDHSTQNALLAELDGKLVGLVHYIYHPHNWRVEDVCYLQDLYADPAVRGQGIGRKLIEAVYEAADKNGTPTVYWMTQETNYTGRQLYDRIASKTEFIQYKR